MNWITEEVQFDSPFGAYNIRFTGGGGHTGTIFDEEDYQNHLNEFEERDKSFVEKIVITRLIDDKLTSKLFTRNEPKNSIVTEL
jgi:hypothetical protein